jgi:hypothetical protein
MRRVYIISVGTGIAVLWLTQWALTQWIQRTVITPNGWLSGFVWSQALTDLFIGFALLAPGVCAGWISRRHGILVGALTGALGIITYNVIGSRFLYAIHHRFDFADIYWGFWSAQLRLILTCAAGGAAGQIMRSSNRWSGP